MDNKIASTPEQQNQMLLKKTLEMHVVEVERKNQPMTNGVITKSTSKGSIHAIRSTKKGANRVNNYSVNVYQGHNHQNVTGNMQQSSASETSNQERGKKNAQPRLNGHGVVVWQHNEELHQRGVEVVGKGDAKPNSIAQQQSTKRLSDLHPAAHLQLTKETQIISGTPHQPAAQSYNSQNSRHLSNSSKSKAQLQAQSLQQISGMKMVSAKQTHHQGKLHLDQNWPRKEPGEQPTHAKAHGYQVVKAPDKRSSHSQTAKGHQQNVGSHLSIQIQKPLSVIQPSLNSSSAQQHKTHQSLVPPIQTIAVHQFPTSELQSTHETRKLFEEQRGFTDVNIAASVLQKAGQSQIKYGSKSSIEPGSSASALSQSQASGKKNIKRRQLQEHILTSQTISTSSKLVKNPIGASLGSSSVRQNKSKRDYGLHDKQKVSVDMIAERQSFPSQHSTSSIFMAKPDQMQHRENPSKQQQREKARRSPSASNLQEQASNQLKQNRKGSRAKVVQLPTQANQSQSLSTAGPVLGKNRPQSNTVDHYYAQGNTGGAQTQHNSNSGASHPSQAQLHSKYKNNSKKNSKGASLTYNHSIRNDNQSFVGNQVANEQIGTIAHATLNTQYTQGDQPVYKNRAPKFVPAEKLKVRLGPSKADTSIQNDRRIPYNQVNSAGNKLSLRISKHAINGMNAKNSYRIKNHVLSSDSTSSDEYMYEEVIEGQTPTPLETSPSPIKKNEKQQVHIKQPSVSDGEVHNGEECEGDALYDEGEYGEEDLDYVEYGENDDLYQEEEAINNAGEDNEEESTKLNTQEQKSESESRIQVIQGQSGQFEATQREKAAPGGEKVVNGEQAENKKSTGQLVKKKKVPRLIMNLIYTFYPVVKKVAKQLNYRCRCEDIQLLPPPIGSDDYYRAMNGFQMANPPDFDVVWFDNPIPCETLAKIKPYQRISQYPGIAVVSNKSKLARNLMKMQKQFPEEYDFFPKTFVLPVEYNEFKVQFERHARAMKGTYNQPDTTNYRALANQTFIIKPDNLCQGKGIFLVKDPDDVRPNDHVVAQKYITNPLLIDDLKFDLRIYVLLFGINPLRIFFFKDGLVRFATEPYQKPNESNIDNLFMHLTNYAINKNSEAFVQNEGGDGTDEDDDDGTHKRSLKSLWSTLRIMGHNVKKLKAEIKDIVIKTMITAQPSLCHLVRSCQPDDVENQLCFQILGFDVMIDNNMKPWLIEVNQSPSFKTESGLDSRIKQKLVEDTLRLLNLSWRRKSKIMYNMKQEMKKRMLTGKKEKLTPEEKVQKIKEMQALRNQFEMANLGDFKLIYPCESADRQAQYDIMLEASAENWEDFTTGRKRKNFQTSTNWNGEGEEPGAFTNRQIQQVDSNGKPIWRASGVVRNYVPAWERSFKKSMIAKQQRLEQAKKDLNNQTPLTASEKHPPLNKNELQSPKIEEAPSKSETPAEKPQQYDNDSPLKFTLQYGHEPQSKVNNDQSQAAYQGQSAMMTPQREKDNLKSQQLSSNKKPTLQMMGKRLTNQKVLPTSQFQLNFSDVIANKSYQPQGVFRSSQNRGEQDIYAPKSISTQIRTTELKAQQSRDSVNHIHNPLRNSIQNEQDRPITNNRQFISRQSIQGRQSRTSMEKQLATPNHQESEKAELPGVDKFGPVYQQRIHGN